VENKQQNEGEEKQKEVGCNKTKLKMLLGSALHLELEQHVSRETDSVRERERDQCFTNVMERSPIGTIFGQGTLKGIHLLSLLLLVALVVAVAVVVTVVAVIIIVVVCHWNCFCFNYRFNCRFAYYPLAARSL